MVASEINVHHARDIQGVGFMQRLARHADTGVIDPHVHPVETCRSCIPQPLQLGSVGYLTGLARHFIGTVTPRQIGDHCIYRRLLTTADHHRTPPGQEIFRQTAANAARTASDYYCFHRFILRLARRDAPVF